jgi:hypothetical protein
VTRRITPGPRTGLENIVAEMDRPAQERLSASVFLFALGMLTLTAMIWLLGEPQSHARSALCNAFASFSIDQCGARPITSQDK